VCLRTGSSPGIIREDCVRKNEGQALLHLLSPRLQLELRDEDQGIRSAGGVPDDPEERPAGALEAADAALLQLGVITR
jgi:hypothetical protein